MKLKLELFRYGTLVFGKVLEQAEELRQTTSKKITILAKQKEEFSISEFAVETGNYPVLGNNTLAIRGTDRSKDHIVFWSNYCDEDRATGICETIKDLVAEINSDTDADLGGIVRVM